MTGRETPGRMTGREHKKAGAAGEIANPGRKRTSMSSKASSKTASKRGPGGPGDEIPDNWAFGRSWPEGVVDEMDRRGIRVVVEDDRLGKTLAIDTQGRFYTVGPHGAVQLNPRQALRELGKMTCGEYGLFRGNCNPPGLLTFCLKLADRLPLELVPEGQVVLSK